MSPTEASIAEEGTRECVAGMVTVSDAGIVVVQVAVCVVGAR